MFLRLAKSRTAHPQVLQSICLSCHPCKRRSAYELTHYNGGINMFVVKLLRLPSQPGLAQCLCLTLGAGPACFTHQKHGDVPKFRCAPMRPLCPNSRHGYSQRSKHRHLYERQCNSCHLHSLPFPARRSSSGILMSYLEQSDVF